jgi:glycosyltransferase involved in cell wall biosynthesis
LVPELKLEGLLSTCDAVGELSGEGFPVRLVIVGDGRARSQIASRAEGINAAVGRTAIFLTGEIADPRPAYAAADIIVGQGGSALRGMAFGKPLIVVGEDGFSELLTPDSAPLFLSQGWYGLGAGSLGSGSPALRFALARLFGSPTSRQELGTFARRLVVERFSLKRAAALQEDIYLTAMSDRVAAGSLIADVARCAGGVLISKVGRSYRRRFGFDAIDDANARSVVADVLTGAHRGQPGN